MINLIFSLWVAFAAYRGYRSGWLSMLLGLAAFFLGYLVCFLGTEALAEVFRTKGMNALYAILLAAILLFSGTGFLVSTLPRWVLARLGWASRGKRSLLGAALGVVSGLISGLLILWAVSLVRVAFPLPMEPSGIERQAHKLVGTVAEFGVDVSGAKGIKAKASKALFKDPQAFTQSLKSLAESNVLKAFVNDENAQRLMREKNINALLTNPNFVALAEHESMQLLMLDQQDQEKPGKQELAENITEVWQKMQVLKHDPEIQGILQDEEIKKLMAQNNPLVLLSNKKFQIIINRVMETDLSEVDLSTIETQNVETVDKAVGNMVVSGVVNEAASSEENKETAIYQWRDDQGKMQFSDYQSIPVQKREQALQLGEKTE